MSILKPLERHLDIESESATAETQMRYEFLGRENKCIVDGNMLQKLKAHQD